MTPIEKQREWIEILKVVDTVFRESNITYWLDFGTLLCAYRDGNLGNEHDLDIGIFGEDYKKVSNLNPIFNRLGFGTCTFYPALHNVLFTGEVRDDTHLLDMVAWFKLNDKVRSIIAQRLPWTMPLRFFTSFKKISFRKLSDYEFPVPAETEEYLEQTFGKDWETPLSNEVYREFVGRCVSDISIRPRCNLPYPNHRELFEKATDHIVFEYPYSGRPNFSSIRGKNE